MWRSVNNLIPSIRNISPGETWGKSELNLSKFSPQSWREDDPNKVKQIKLSYEYLLKKAVGTSFGVQ